MKKLIIFFYVLALILLPLSIRKNNLCDFNFGKNYTYIAYLNQTECLLNNCESVANGNTLIVKTTPKYSQFLYYNVSSVFGEALEFTTQDKENTLQKIVTVLNATYVDIEYVNSIKILYFYSPNLTNFVYKNTQKINLQIAITNTGVIAGYPLIMHSF